MSLIWLQWDQSKQRSLSKKQRELDVSQFICPYSNFRRDSHLEIYLEKSLRTSPACSKLQRLHFFAQILPAKTSHRHNWTILPVSNPKLGTMSTVPWKAPAHAEVALVTAAGSVFVTSHWGAGILAVRTEGISRDPYRGSRCELGWWWCMCGWGWWRCMYTSCMCAYEGLTWDAKG